MKMVDMRKEKSECKVEGVKCEMKSEIVRGELKRQWMNGSGKLEVRMGIKGESGNVK